VYKLLCLDEKKFSSNFTIRVTLTEKNSNFFFHPNITIYTPFDSPCRVDKKCAVIKNVYSDFRAKIS
jgi:hypothetical protein